jgi:cadmium resistance protein CadD (predicted permease)
MGFAHSMIEDTIIVIAMGADAISIFFGRFLFAIIATSMFAYVLKHIPDRWFFLLLYVPRQPKLRGASAC